MSGRSPFQASTSEKQGSTSTLGDPVLKTEESRPGESHLQHPSHVHHRHRRHHQSNIMAQVADWLKHEKAKKALRGSRKRNDPSRSDGATSIAKVLHETGANDSSLHVGGHTQTPSEMSDEGVDLDQLEQILSGIEASSDAPLTPKPDKKDSYFPHHQFSRPKSYRKASIGASSDREFVDDDALAPSAEVILDNSKTLAYSSSAAASTVSLSETNRRVVKERDAWLHFKNEIVRLAHTLKLKGWRRVPLDRGGEIDVERLSGALTNAVYVVSPPNNLPQATISSRSGEVPSSPRKLPPPP